MKIIAFFVFLAGFELVSGPPAPALQGGSLCGWSNPCFCSCQDTPRPSCCKTPFLSSLLTRFVFPLCLGNVTTSTSVSQMASGISLVSFNSRPDGLHQRSYSVSSADQWSEATVIANSGISSGKKPGALGWATCFGVNGDFGALAVFQKKKKMKLCRPFVVLGAELAVSEGKIGIG